MQVVASAVGWKALQIKKIQIFHMYISLFTVSQNKVFDRILCILYTLYESELRKTTIQTASQNFKMNYLLLSRVSV
jgi:hypothetical protein